MSKASRIQECIDKHDEYVLTLAAMPDKKLVEKLDAIHQQMALAEQQSNTEALELLEIWRAQTIEARTYKAENNIADSGNDIEEAIADIETFVAEAEKRIEVLEEYSNATTTARRKVKSDTDDKQLSFF